MTSHSQWVVINMSIQVHEKSFSISFFENNTYSLVISKEEARVNGDAIVGYASCKSWAMLDK